MVSINQGTVKGFFLVVVLFVFAIVLLGLKIFKKQSIRAMLVEYERYFVVSYGLAFVLLVLVALTFFLVNN